MKNAIRVLTIAIALSFAGHFAQAHHSRAVYDLSKIITLNNAKVVEWRWSNPHTMMKLQVKNAQGGVDEWILEGGSPSFLARAGWKRTDIVVGTTITVAVHPLRDGTKGGSFNKITLADGRVLGRAGEPGPDEKPAKAPPAPVKQDDPI